MRMFDLPEISISTAGFQSEDRSTRSMISQIHSMRSRGIALDGSAPDCLARELTRSARRDLASTLRRNELDLTGLDLWIPPEHFVDQSTVQRAMDALNQAAELSSELAQLVGGRSRPIVSVILPKELPAIERSSIGSSAQRVGALIVDHQPEIENPIPGIRIGIDPSMILLDGRSPGKAITQAGPDLGAVRLNDMNAMGRCAIGAPGSKLDLKGFAGALLVSGQEWITLDVREIPDPQLACQKAQHAWVQALSF